MKNTLKTLGILIGIILIFSSCEKIDVPHGTPRCIIKKIRQEKDNILDKVYKYDYHGEIVYEFCPPLYTPDGTSYVYNANCDLICSMGGYSGQGYGQCPDFGEQATNQELIWSQ